MCKELKFHVVHTSVQAVQMQICEENGFILIAAHEFDARRRMISKTFYQQLRSSERQSLVGPPESMREHVVAASKAMRNGNWSACKNFIINEKMNAKVMLISIVTFLHSGSFFDVQVTVHHDKFL
jgi:hypothetical protein